MLAYECTPPVLYTHLFCKPGSCQVCPVWRWMLYRACLSAQQFFHTSETAQLLRCMTVFVQKTVSFIAHYKSSYFQILFYQSQCSLLFSRSLTKNTRQLILKPLLHSQTAVWVVSIQSTLKWTQFSFYPLAAETSPTLICTRLGSDL